MPENIAMLTNLHNLLDHDATQTQKPEFILVTIIIKNPTVLIEKRLDLRLL